MLGLSSNRALAPFTARPGTWGWGEGLRALMRGEFPQPADSLLPNLDAWASFGLPAAWRCVNLVADSAATLPMLAYHRDSDTGSEERLDPTPPILSDPWPLLDVHNWVGGAVLSLMLRGNAYMLPADPDPATGYPRQLPLLNPDHVWVDVDDRGLPVYDVNGTKLGPGEIVHVRGITPPGAVAGVGIVEAHRRNLTSMVAMQNYGSSTYASAGVPSGIITVDRNELGQEQADDIKARWVAAFAARREPAVVPRSITFKPLSFSPEDLSYLESRKWSATEICWICGVHPMVIGAPSGSSMTYANLEAMRSAFAQDSVMPWTARIEQTLSKWVPRTLRVRFNYDAYLRSTTLDRYQSYVIGLENGFLTIDEVRDLEHRPRLPEPEPVVVEPPIDNVTPLSGGAAA